MGVGLSLCSLVCLVFICIEASNADAPPQSGAPAPNNPSKNKGSKKIAFFVVFPILALMLVLVCLGFAYRRRTKFLATKQFPRNGVYRSLGPYTFQTDSSSWVVDVKLPSSLPIVIIDKPLLNLTFADLLAATSDFDRGTLLAEGRFGPVYIGVLPGEVHVAIKVLVHDSVLTDEEATAELEHLGRIKHPNLVPLIGYCLAGRHRIVVYDHMENSNLHNLLHGLPLGCNNDAWGDDSNGIGNIITEGKNTWPFRHRIALGIARGLAFLHHGCSPQIVHGDVQANSILLDSEFEPRLSDYGLAELIRSDFVEENPYGSPGHMPQILSGSEIRCGTPESDVYAFGVVLFELITGKKPFDIECQVKDADMVSWVRGLVSKNQLSDAIDMKIQGTGPEKQMEEAFRIGYLCTAEVPSKRPSMQQIVGLLKDIEPRELNN